MQGYLKSKGVHISEKKIASSLQRVAPHSYEQRTHNTIDRTNPVPYQALFFGHKLHIDQNEKLVMFGVTHLIAVDGFSGMVVAYVTVAIKNNRLAYEYLFRYVSNLHCVFLIIIIISCLYNIITCTCIVFCVIIIMLSQSLNYRKFALEYGLWEQLRVDCGA